MTKKRENSMINLKLETAESLINTGQIKDFVQRKTVTKL